LIDHPTSKSTPPANVAGAAPAQMPLPSGAAPNL
jgi:hypothetical protein